MEWMFQTHAPLAVRWNGSLFQLRWMAQVLRNCLPERHAVDEERMVRVAAYGGARLQQLRADTGILEQALEVSADGPDVAILEATVALGRSMIQGPILVPGGLLEQGELSRRVNRTCGSSCFSSSGRT